MLFFHVLGLFYIHTHTYLRFYSYTLCYYWMSCYSSGVFLQVGDGWDSHILNTPLYGPSSTFYIFSCFIFTVIFCTKESCSMMHEICLALSTSLLACYLWRLEVTRLLYRKCMGIFHSAISPSCWLLQMHFSLVVCGIWQASRWYIFCSSFVLEVIQEIVMTTLSTWICYSCIQQPLTVLLIMTGCHPMHNTTRCIFINRHLWPIIETEEKTSINGNMHFGMYVLGLWWICWWFLTMTYDPEDFNPVNPPNIKCYSNHLALVLFV